MFSSKQRPDQAQAIHTLLGKGTLWKGEIQAGQNSLRIEGNFDGIIRSEGEVTIAPTGEVQGTIEARHLIVTGRVLGNFKIMECLEIHGTGYVEGDVEVGSLVVDEGGTLQGTCTRRGVAKAGKEAKETKEAKEPERDKPERSEKDAPFVPFPAPPSMPASTGAFGASSRADEAAADRHVFNPMNGTQTLPSMAEHGHVKAKF